MEPPVDHRFERSRQPIQIDLPLPFGGELPANGKGKGRILRQAVAHIAGDRRDDDGNGMLIEKFPEAQTSAVGRTLVEKRRLPVEQIHNGAGRGRLGHIDGGDARLLSRRGGNGYGKLFNHLKSL